MVCRVKNKGSIRRGFMRALHGDTWGLSVVYGKCFREALRSDTWGLSIGYGKRFRERINKVLLDDVSIDAKRGFEGHMTMF